MNDRRLNWPLWTGLVLSIVAVFSYAFFFYRFPITRDVPWVSYILLAAAIVLLIVGVRRAFSGGMGRKIVAIIIAVIGVGLAALLSQPMGAAARRPKGVLLVFYRGYW